LVHPGFLAGVLKILNTVGWRRWKIWLKVVVSGVFVVLLVRMFESPSQFFLGKKNTQKRKKTSKKSQTKTTKKRNKRTCSQTKEKKPRFICVHLF
jgi:hypothetical protein